MPGLTLQQAALIVDAALAKGRDVGLMPLTVAALDAGGHLVAFKREDGSGILRPGIAIGKAWGALGMGAPSRSIRDRLQDRPTFVNALAAASNGRFIPVPGGVLIRDNTGDGSVERIESVLNGCWSSLTPDEPRPRSSTASMSVWCKPARMRRGTTRSRVCDAGVFAEAAASACYCASAPPSITSSLPVI